MQGHGTTERAALLPHQRSASSASRLVSARDALSPHAPTARHMSADLGASPALSGATGFSEPPAEVIISPMLSHRLYPQRHQRLHSESTIAKHIPKRHVLAFANGHVLNDMCAACWFTYLLIFLKNIVKLPPSQAGWVMFAGQAADALATPIVGALSDKSAGCPRFGMGKRAAWNFGGALIVLVCFSLVFAVCVPCWAADPVPDFTLFLYYCLAASLFNVGWAAVQVSHMALVPEMSSDPAEHVLLNSARYAATVLSNVAVFVVFYFLLKFVPPASERTADKYHALGYIVAGVGAVCTAVFLIGTPFPAADSDLYGDLDSRSRASSVESDRSLHALPTLPELEVAGGQAAPGAAHLAKLGGAEAGAEAGAGAGAGAGAEAEERVQRRSKRTKTRACKRVLVRSWADWFRHLVFYQVAVVYMCTRLAVNLSQVYIPFFITDTLDMDDTALALVPLVIYIGSLAATAAMKRMDAKLGSRGAFTIGSVLVLAPCTCFLFLPKSASWAMYPLALVLGWGNAATMVISVSMEADLVGPNVHSGAFVYGVMSFTDKLSNGVAVIIIENMVQKLPDADCGDFFRQVVSYVPAVSALLAALVVCITQLPERPQRRRRRRQGDGGDFSSLEYGCAAGDAPLLEHAMPTGERRVSLT